MLKIKKMVVDDSDCSLGLYIYFLSYMYSLNQLIDELPLQYLEVIFACNFFYVTYFLLYSSSDVLHYC